MSAAVVRAFIALDLTPDVCGQLDQVIAQLKQRAQKAPVRWVPAHNMHLTLKFLGDVSTANLAMIKDAIQVEAGRWLPFEMHVAGIGAFPSLRKPRVVWVGVQAPPELAVLQAGVETEVARLGYPREQRLFSPHLTLGRVAHDASPAEAQRLGEMIGGLPVGELGVVPVTAVHLYRSDLKPTGSIYTRLFSALLAAGSQAQR